MKSYIRKHQRLNNGLKTRPSTIYNLSYSCLYKCTPYSVGDDLTSRTSFHSASFLQPSLHCLRKQRSLRLSSSRACFRCCDSCTSRVLSWVHSFCWSLAWSPTLCSWKSRRSRAFWCSSCSCNEHMTSVSISPTLFWRGIWTQPFLLRKRCSWTMSHFVLDNLPEGYKASEPCERGCLYSFVRHVCRIILFIHVQIKILQPKLHLGKLF